MFARPGTVHEVPLKELVSVLMVWEVWRLLLLLQALYCRPEVKSRVMCLWLVLRSLHFSNPIRVTRWKPLKNKFICASSAWPERTLRTVKVGQRSHSGQLEHTLLWLRGNELEWKKVRERESDRLTAGAEWKAGSWGVEGCQTTQWHGF